MILIYQIFYLFYIDVGYVRLESCIFEREELNEGKILVPLSHSLFIYTDDSDYITLNLLYCSFSNIGSEQSLILNCSGGLSFYSFINLINKNGNDGVIETSCKHLAVVGSVFNNCICENENGGPLYIVDIQTLIIGEYINSTKFINCKAKVNNDNNNNLKAGYGGSIYLELSYV